MKKGIDMGLIILIFLVITAFMAFGLWGGFFALVALWVVLVTLERIR